jgi:flagellar biosynthesis protein FliQ
MNGIVPIKISSAIKITGAAELYFVAVYSLFITTAIAENTLKMIPNILAILLTIFPVVYLTSP